MKKLVLVCSIALIGVGSVRADILGSDDFNRADGLIGSGWTDLAGVGSAGVATPAWLVENNEARVTHYAENITPAITEYAGYQLFSSSTGSGYQETISADMRNVVTSDTRWFGLAVHIQAADPSQYYQVRANFGGGNTLQLIDPVSGENASTALSETLSGTYRMEVITGNTGGLTVNMYNSAAQNIGSLSYTFANVYTGGSAGLYANYAFDRGRWDNFQIANNIPEPSTLVLSLGGLFAVGLVRRRLVL